MMTSVRTYSELSQYSTLEDRFRYLSLAGQVGAATFGHDRWLNQRFYRSAEWRRIRDYVIVRDDACDLGVPGYDIHDRVIIHHMNPMVAADIVHANEDLVDPEFLITTTHATHNAIHYGDESLLPRQIVPRGPGDTQLWSRRN
jgi:hypothetical protein